MSHTDHNLIPGPSILSGAVDDSGPGPFVHDINVMLPRHLRYKAVLAAISERPDNAPFPDIALALAVARNRVWANGKELRIRFLDAHNYSTYNASGAWRISAVMESANEWTRHANLTFVKSTADDAEIRVTFGGRGCWSYIGVEATTIAQNQATLNLEVMSGQNPRDFRKYVLHEFGHAIGCVHEHQTPVAGIPWNRERVYEFYRQTQGWDRTMVDTQVLNVFAQPSTNHLASETRESATRESDTRNIEVSHTVQFDRNSIMVYPISRELTDGTFEVAWNGELSALDIEFVGSVYPKPSGSNAQ